MLITVRSEFDITTMHTRGTLQNTWRSKNGVVRILSHTSGGIGTHKKNLHLCAKKMQCGLH